MAKVDHEIKTPQWCFTFRTRSMEGTWKLVNRGRQKRFVCASCNEMIRKRNAATPA